MMQRTFRLRRRLLVRTALESFKRCCATSDSGVCGPTPPTICAPIPAFDSHASSSTIVPVFKKAGIYLDKIALKDCHGHYSYYSLAMGAKQLCRHISYELNNKTGAKVAFLCPNDGTYVLAQWATWMSGQVAVPLSHLHPPESLEYYVTDSEASVLITTPMYADIMDTVAKKTKKKLIFIDDSLRRGSMYDAVDASQLTVDNAQNLGHSAEFYAQSKAMIIYTSGTTGQPKGVVLTHRNLQAQMMMLIKAWQWSHEDNVLHTLPLHHIHGIVNVLMCPMYVGAKCVMLPKYDSTATWSHLLSINLRPEDRINVYMGVPTIYTKLLQEYDKIFRTNPKMAEYVKHTLSEKVRLMVCGSASLPTPVFNRWHEISGHRLLERYGMTEIGMCLSNLYEEWRTTEVRKDVTEQPTASGVTSFRIEKPKVREPGYVGLPLPGVQIRLAEKVKGTEYKTILECNGSVNALSDICVSYFGDVWKPPDDASKPPSNEEQSPEAVWAEESQFPTGEILVKGEAVFQEYYRKPLETKVEFTSDGWFCTGDTALYDPRKQLFKMLGRTSVDIIKTGAYKVSSLQVETLLLSYPEIEEVAVIALPDLTWGEKVAAVVVLKQENHFAVAALRDWAKTKLAAYCIPQVYRVVQELPKNAMGKVNKKSLAKLVFHESFGKEMK